MSASLFDTPQRILLTGVRAPAAPDLLRWLTTQGHRVSTSDCLHWPLGRACRDSHAFLRYPSPRRHTAAFHAWALGVARDFDWIIPCCEEVFWLAAIPGLPLFAPDRALLLRLHHKADLVALVNALSHRVRAPETHLLSSTTNPAAVAIPPGWIAKPAYGRFGHRNLIGPAILPRRLSPEAWIRQRLITGSETCLHLIALRGEVRALVVYRDPGRLDRGPCLAFQRQHDPVLEDFAHAFCRHYALTGQFGFDVITDAFGHSCILDCNPRLTSGQHLITRPHAAIVQLTLARRLRACQRHDTPLTRNAPDCVDFPGDSGPSRLMPFTALEILARFPRTLAAASTADLQWP